MRWSPHGALGKRFHWILWIERPFPFPRVEYGKRPELQVKRPVLPQFCHLVWPWRFHAISPFSHLWSVGNRLKNLCNSLCVSPLTRVELYLQLLKNINYSAAPLDGSRFLATVWSQEARATCWTSPNSTIEKLIGLYLTCQKTRVLLSALPFITCMILVKRVFWGFWFPAVKSKDVFQIWNYDWISKPWRE